MTKATQEGSNLRASEQVHGAYPGGQVEPSLRPGPVEPPDFDLTVTIHSPADGQVLHPTNLPLRLDGSTTHVSCVIQRVDVQLGAGAPFVTATPLRPGDWSQWSFSGMPSPALGVLKVVVRASGYYVFRTRVPISDEAEITLFLAPGIAVPAFWTVDPSFAPQWQSLEAEKALSLPSITVVGDDSWPATAQSNPAWKAATQVQLGQLSGNVLGYVSTRAGSTILPTSQIMATVQGWRDQFGANIQGIYFDQLILPEVSTSVNEAKALVQTFRSNPNYSGWKLMILAGQCVDPFAVDPSVDYALMWEDTQAAYVANFTGGNGAAIPSWWKDPALRNKIVHVVHDCAESDRQRAIGLANERNAGHVFVMDRRGLLPNSNPPQYVLYDHLPPYWDTEAREVNSFLDFGFPGPQVLLAAHRYGVSQGAVHAWPNFEGAWYATGHVRGTFLLSADPNVSQADVLLSALPGNPEPFDIVQLWYAAHQYAVNHGYATAVPTFEQVATAGGVAMRLVFFGKNASWLVPLQVPVTATYQQPTFAEAGSVIRNVGRAVSAQGAFVASFPTFQPDDVTNPRGRTQYYNAYGVKQGGPVVWRDVPSLTYVDQLR